VAANAASGAGTVVTVIRASRVCTGVLVGTGSGALWQAASTRLRANRANRGNARWRVGNWRRMAAILPLRCAQGKLRMSCP